MTNAEKQAIINMPTVGYYSGYFGLAIKSIEYGIDDYIIYTDNEFTKKGVKAHRSKIYYEDDDTYFMYGKYKISLNEVMRK